MTQEQAARLRAILATCDVPTAQTAVEKVKGLFNIKFSISGMTHWLNRNRFSFKKSEPAPAKADPLAPSRIFLNRWSKLSKSLTTRFADNFQVIQKPAF